MMNTAMISAPVLTDADLVSQTRAGNRDAFGHIVSRYQTLVCSLAYSALGSLGQSEDLAQETFITAWKHLGHLREPSKLRAWICGIARNRINDFLRREGRQPLRGAEPLEMADGSVTEEAAPSEHTMTKEEEAILWRSLEQIPELYREPLILFYRQGQSVQCVADALNLSEDAVKQRLSRGRKLLQQQVLAFVQGALERTNPGKAFTVAVLMSLPAFTLSASAATVGAAAAKTGATAKALAVGGVVGAILSPFLGFFGTWAGYRMDLCAAQSDRERSFIKHFYRLLGGFILGFLVLYAALFFSAPLLHRIHPLLFSRLLIGLAVGYLIASAILMVKTMRARRALMHTLDAERTSARPARPSWEYRSQLTLLGLPFVHLRIGGGMGAQRAPVKAWIAAGDCAIGILVAFGGLAIAPISIGGCALGLLPFGGFAIGPVALGGMAIGLFALGGTAVGWQAFGGCGIAWDSALGGAAVARDFALGAIAQAAHANNEAAKLHIDAQPFFHYASRLVPYFFFMHLLWIIPILLWWRTVARDRRGRPTETQPAAS